MTNDPGRDAWIGRLQIALAGVLWSTSGFFAKSPWFDAWPEDSRGLLLAFFRALFAIPALVPLVRRYSWQWQMIPMMVCFAIMVWSFMSAVVHGPAANAIWLQYLCPVWVMIANYCLLREPVTRLDIWMFLLCIGGVGFILGCEMVHGGNLKATLLGILSGVGFAAVVMFIRSLNHADPSWLIVLNHSATVLLLAPWAVQSHRWISPTSYVALAFFGVFQMSLAYILFARGLRSTASHEASILSLIEPILVPVWVFIAWRNHPSYDSPPWWTWVGAGLICAGMLCRYWQGLTSLLRRRNSPDNPTADI